MKHLLLSLGLLTFTSLALAKTNHFVQAPPLVKTEYKWLSKAELPKELAEAKKRFASRKVASEIGPQSVAPDMAMFIDKFLALKTPDEIDAALASLDASYDSFSPDLRFVASQVAPLRKMRGLVYRLLPIAEREKITYSMLLTGVRSIASSLRIYMPEAHVENLFAYVTEPYLVDGKPVAQFTEAWQFQDYITQEIYPEALRSLQRLKNIDLKNKRIVWDNRLLTGSTTFLDGVQRFMVISEGEKQGLLGSLHMGLAGLCVFTAYNVDGFFKYFKQMENLYFFDGFWGSSNIDGVSSYERNKILKKGEFKNLYTLRNGGELWTNRAFLHLQNSIFHGNIALEEFRDQPANSQAFVNPALVTPWLNTLDRSLDNLKAMLEGPTEIRNNVTGDVTVVNVPEFYKKPPQDLKRFAPTNWELTSKFKTVKGIKTVNFHYGRGISWDASAYAPYLPGVKGNTDILRVLRIFDQNWSGAGMAFPLFMFVR